MSPAELILSKNLEASGLSSAEWEKVSAALRERSFFSSRVQSLRFLEVARDQIAALLSGRGGVPPPPASPLASPPSPPAAPLPSRASAVSAIMQAAREAAIATGSGDLTDPGSPSRAALIVDTNAALAAGYCAAEQANTYGARLAFPAQELVRIEARAVPRNWAERWTAAGGRFSAGYRMVALKGDPVWVRLSRFGQPYPPFDFNSGMGLEDVSFDEAVELGLISPAYKPPFASPIKPFNEGLEADLEFKNDKT